MISFWFRGNPVIESRIVDWWNEKFNYHRLSRVPIHKQTHGQNFKKQNCAHEIHRNITPKKPTTSEYVWSISLLSICVLCEYHTNCECPLGKILKNRTVPMKFIGILPPKNPLRLNTCGVLVSYPSAYFVNITQIVNVNNFL